MGVLGFLDATYAFGKAIRFFRAFGEEFMIAGCFGTSFEWATGVLLLTAENNCLSRNQVCTYARKTKTWSFVCVGSR